MNDIELAVVSCPAEMKVATSSRICVSLIGRAGVLVACIEQQREQVIVRVRAGGAVAGDHVGDDRVELRHRVAQAALPARPQLQRAVHVHPRAASTRPR